MQVIRKVEQRIRQERLLEPGEPLIVAVSGGPDSMALIHILLRLAETWKWNLVIGHVNHQFRREESESEARFVQEWAGSMGIPCEMATIDVPAYIQQTGDNAQNAARKLRFRFLEQTAKRYKADKIVFGHHADDQAETILMRLMRGTGPTGLTGMAYSQTWRKLKFIRPLLDMRKEQLISYCVNNKVQFVTDSSNAERKYTRNRVRLDTIPYLQSYSPNLVEHLNRLADMMREEEDYLHRESSKVFQSLVRLNSDREASFSAKAFIRLHVALQRRLIKLILNYLDCNADSVDFTAVETMRLAIGRETPSNLTLDIHKDLIFMREYDRVSMVRSFKPTAFFEYELDFREGCFELPEVGKCVKYVLSDVQTKSHDRLSLSEAVFDYDELRLPLKIRNRRNGDRIQVYGLNGSKKVKDIFIDAKLPPRQRANLPLLVDSENSVLWIPGLKRSAQAAVSERTTRFLYITIDEKQSEMV